MKGLVIFIVVGIIALVLVFQFGGYSSLDPAEQAQQFREQVSEGMTWEQVADVREPRRFTAVNPNAMGGQGLERDFDRQSLADDISDNERLRHGFVFLYRFDASHHYDIVFSPQGEVVAVNEPRTAKDLYEGQLFTH